MTSWRAIASLATLITVPPSWNEFDGTEDKYSDCVRFGGADSILILSQHPKGMPHNIAVNITRLKEAAAQ